jgi:hypothetical protein
MLFARGRLRGKPSYQDTAPVDRAPLKEKYMRKNSTQIKRIAALALTLALLVTALPAAAGSFEWSRLGRLIPQTGFEPTVSVIASHPAEPAVLYAGTLRSTSNNNLVFKSINGGVSWFAASSGMPTSMPQNTGISDLIVRPAAPDQLVAGLFEAGVWRSSNGGQTWIDTSGGTIANNDHVRALAIDAAHPDDVYALTGSGVHISQNGGIWQSRSAGLPAPSAVIFNDLAADPLHPGTLYVATNPLGLYRSTNGGQTWQPANDGLPTGTLDVRGVATSSANGRLLISVSGQGLWRSDNQGGSWQRSDSGITYNSTLQGNVGIPVLSQNDAKTAYVYNNDGVFASSDGGERWTSFNDGFNGAETITTMAFHSAAPNTVYAGTAVSGVWSLTVVPGGRYFLPLVIR